MTEARPSEPAAPPGAELELEGLSDEDWTGYAGAGPTLSICIATFNRSTYIVDTLASILKQDTPELEIVILDASSDEETAHVVRPLAQRSPRLRFFHQRGRGGVDRDFDRAVRLARGTYCWLMSDDDLLQPGAVREVLERCRMDYSLIIVNAEVWDSTLSNRLERRRLALPSDLSYRPSEMEQLLVVAARYMSFAGCVVVRRDEWLVRDRESYFGSFFAHVGIVFQRPLPRGAHIISAPLIVIRFGNASWTDRTFEIWMFKWPNLIWSLADYSDSAKAAICRREPWLRARTLLIFRARGAYSRETYKRYIRPRLRFGFRRFALMVIASIPGVIANSLCLLYYQFHQVDSSLDVFELRQSRFYPTAYFRRVLKRIVATG